MSKVYISGKISGLPMDEVAKKFNEAEVYLRNRDFVTVNPIGLDHSANINEDWFEYLKVDIAAMMSCDTVAFLPCWQNSKGAKLEFTIAGALNFNMMFLGDVN